MQSVPRPSADHGLEGGGVARPLRAPHQGSALHAPDFEHVAAEAAFALHRIATRRHFAANEFLYLQDDVATHLYIVSSGYVRLSHLMEDGSAILHAILPPGQVFGELGVFENSSYCDMATAAGPMSAACIPVGAFRTLCHRHPDLSDVLGRIVARRYRSYITVMRDLSLKTLSARLAQAVLRLIDGIGTKRSHGGRQVACIGAMVSQTDFGLMARGSRGNVNRVLKQWERAGWIAMQDRCVFVLDRTKLETLALTEDL